MGIEIIGKLTQKNNGDFKLVDLADVDYDGTGKSAKEALDEKSTTAIDDNSTTATDKTLSVKKIHALVEQCVQKEEGKKLSSNDYTTAEKEKLSALENYDDSEIKASINNKADKNEIFSMANMGQDIKEAMTGGSVAVVGKNAVLTENIANEQIYPEKTSFFIENLLDKTAVEEGGYYDSSNNKISNTNYVETDYIPILSNQILMLSKNCVGIGTQIIKFYGVDKQFIAGQNSTTDNGIAGQICQSLHDNASYIRISLSKSSLDTYMITTGEKVPSKIVPYGINFKNENSITRQLKNNTLALNQLLVDMKVISKWKNKKWCVVGDSITEVNSTSNTKYHDIIKNKIGCTVYNQGKSGTGYAVSYSGGKAIVDRINDIPEDSDLITIFAGTNDWGRNLTTLGTFSDTTKDTFYGALKLSIEAIINNFPTKRIGIITPIPRSNYRNTNKAGENLQQYRDAIIKVCEYYSIPCLDLYKDSGFYPTNATFKTTYIPDGLHPNDAGHEILAEKIEKWIETL